MKEWGPENLSVGRRVNVSTVAQYYRDYVKLMSLAANFEENTRVTSVRKISNQKSTSGMEPISKKISDFEEEGNAVFQQESLYNEQNVALINQSAMGKFLTEIINHCKQTADNLFTFSEEDDFSSCTGVTSSLSSSDVLEEACSDEMIRDINETDVFTESSLSSTRFGQMMKHQARKRANTTCCLDLVSKCSDRHGVVDEEFKFDLSWNPIVFGCEPGPNSLACSFGSYGRSYSWSTSKCRPRRCVPTKGCSLSSESDLWEVTGVQTLATGEVRPFQYLTKNIVLATGSYDKPNSLDIPGESSDFVVHSLKEMEDRIVSGDVDDGPVMIVGAGLSAADAIIAALNKGLDVIHVFRRSADDKRLIFSSLPKAIYPEYHEVHRMMGKKLVGLS